MRYFYPRSPCGERLTNVVSSAGTMGFLSTLSLRRATVNTADKEARKRLISIHALLAESDLILPMGHLMERVFLSTLSLRRATFAAGR